MIGIRLPENDDRWSFLKVDITQIRERYKTDPEGSLSDLAGQLSSDDVVLVFGETIQSPPDVPLAALKRVWMIDPEPLITLSALAEFRRRKGLAILNWKLLEIHDRVPNGVEESENPLVLLYHIFGNDPNHLMDIMIKQMIESKGFKSFEVSGGTRSRAKQDPSGLSEEEFTRALRKADNDIGDGRKSYCWHIIQSGKDVEIYLRREERDFVELAQRNIAELVGKSTIVKILDDARRCELWADRIGVAKKLLNTLGVWFFGDGAEYREQIAYNDSNALEAFVTRVGRGLDPELKMLAFERMNSPLQNAPVVRFEAKLGVVPTLDQLRGLGINLLDSVGIHCSQVTVAFRQEQYIIAVDRRREGCILRALDFTGSSKRLNPLREYLRVNYQLLLTLGGK